MKKLTKEEFLFLFDIAYKTDNINTQKIIDGQTIEKSWNKNCSFFIKSLTENHQELSKEVEKILNLPNLHSNINHVQLIQFFFNSAISVIDINNEPWLFTFLLNEICEFSVNRNNKKASELINFINEKITNPIDIFQKMLNSKDLNHGAGPTFVQGELFNYIRDNIDSIDKNKKIELLNSLRSDKYNYLYITEYSSIIALNVFQKMLKIDKNLKINKIEISLEEDFLKYYENNDKVINKVNVYKTELLYKELQETFSDNNQLIKRLKI